MQVYLSVLILDAPTGYLCACRHFYLPPSPHWCLTHSFQKQDLKLITRCLMARVHKGLPPGSGGREVYRLRMQGWEQWGLQLGTERDAHAECSCRRGRSAGAVPPVTISSPSLSPSRSTVSYTSRYPNYCSLLVFQQRGLAADVLAPEDPGHMAFSMSLHLFPP